jgi:4-amino-4-deoxy-L-arabinose transferase-like glycosyltransferase
MGRSLDRRLPRLGTWKFELGAVLLAAAAIRLAFLSSDPPLLLTTDSLTYALPAHHLAHGQGFDLSLRRTPGYPLFLAGLWAALGDGFQPVAYAQHCLGVATAGLTWWLGRLALGRVAALLGGLAGALSGPQILYEHYLMTEPLFTLVLVLSTAAFVAALRHGSAWLYLASGTLFGLCALTRPIGQVFPLLVPLAVLCAVRPPQVRSAALAGLLAVVGFAFITLPWMARNWLAGGELTGSSALGKTLFGRITRHDEGFRFDLPPAGPSEHDPVRQQARAMARQAAQDDTSRGSLVHERLMREFGYTEAQAYNVMRDTALEVLLAQPSYYLQSSLRGVGELFVGQEESLRAHLERLANPRLRREWQQTPELAPLLPDPVSPQMRVQTLSRAVATVRVYQPSQPVVATAMGILFLTGVMGIALRSAWRTAAPLPLVATAVLVASAFLDGPVPRFRYPVDPLITLTAAGGLVAIVESARSLLRRPVRASDRLAQAIPGRIGRSSAKGAESK